MLALLLLLHHATARDTPQETPVVKEIESCPDVGYYLEREPSLNALEPACQLCFCRGDGAALCWRSGLRRCDDKHYRHYGSNYRFSRMRRSPGISDIFFSDAAKDVFNKNTPEECRPFEASYSEGCPPADWCLGCTVCDCNANGRWDCHTLSFCDDKKGKKKMKKKRRKVGKRQAKTSPTTTTTKKPAPKTTQKPNKNNPPIKSNTQAIKNQRRQKKLQTNAQNKPNKGKPQKVIPVKKTKAPVYKKKPTLKSKEQSKNKLIRKSKHPPALQVVKGNTNTLNENEEIVKNITNNIFKKVMASVEKIIHESQKNITHALQQKYMNKRSMSTQKDMSKKNSNQKPKFKNIKKGSNGMKNNQNLKLNKIRNKREIPAMISSKYYSQEGNVTNATDINVTNKSFVYNTLDNNIALLTPKAKILTKPNYFKYILDSEMVNLNRKLNGTRGGEFLLFDTAKNSSSKATSNSVGVKINASNEGINSFEENKLNTSPKVQVKNNFDDNYFTLKKYLTCGKICNFKKIFKKLIGFDNMNTTMPKRNKVKKLNIFKNLKRVFRKVFIKRKVKDKNSRTNINQSDRTCNLIKILCRNFGFCNVDFSDKRLSHKINQLKAESKKIVQSVASINGLLKLLNLDNKKIKENSIGINKQLSNNDIEKLNAIIKDNYEEYNLDNLTETQRIQVSYIKQNTKICMQSLEKFVQILSDIVKMLTNRKTYHAKVLNHYYSNPKKQALAKVNSNNTVEEKLDKIKELLINYNLVQNKFMKRMYDVVKTLGLKTNHITSNIGVNNENNTINGTAEIEIYTQNIIENLRKLKNLAQKLNIKNRRKREAMDDDDVVEYLLILMEYLLKQQKQLKISPAHDGIDLLIEAIKSAPDIKATRKKVLDFIPLTMEMDTEAALTFRNADKIVNETNDTSNSVIAKFKTLESTDEDEEGSDFYQYNKKFDRKNNFKKENSVTEDMKKEDIINYPLTTLSPYINLVDDEKTYTVLDKTDTIKNDGNKRFEVFIDDTDDDDEIILTTTKPPEYKTIVGEFVTARYNGPTRTSHDNNLRDEQSIYKDSNDTYKSQYNIIKLDWVEDSYRQEDERKELPRLIETTTQKLLPTHTILATEAATRTTHKKEKKVDKYEDPISSVSSEIENEDRKRTKNLNSEYVMYKKQMDLLNSLDYGTEKIEIDADSTEEKSNAEQFPSYFV